jgi:outer membrane biosynthesis protein TonB
MKNEEYNERQLQDLEAKLRAMGTPYNAPMPGEAFFAAQRTKIIEQIDAAPSVSFFTQAKEFFFGSALRISFSAVTAAAVVTTFVLLNRTADELQQTNPPQAVTAPAPAPASNAAPEKNTAEKTEAPRKEKNVAAQKETSPSKPKEELTKSEEPEKDAPKVANPAADPGGKTIADESGNFEDMDVIETSDPETPITYDRLSTEELQGVLKALETTNFEN